jgi:hypothetical protein
MIKKSGTTECTNHTEKKMHHVFFRLIRATNNRNPRTPQRNPDTKSTTDFTDDTDKTKIRFLSVPSVKSVVEFSVAASLRWVLRGLPSFSLLDEIG